MDAYPAWEAPIVQIERPDYGGQLKTHAASTRPSEDGPHCRDRTHGITNSGHPKRYENIAIASGLTMPHLPATRAANNRQTHWLGAGMATRTMKSAAASTAASLGAVSARRSIVGSSRDVGAARQ